MEELYRTIEETIRNSGCPFPADGEEIYNEICDEIENREPGAYVFSPKRRMMCFLNTDCRFLRTTLT